MARISLDWAVSGENRVAGSIDRIRGGFRDARQETERVQAALEAINRTRITVQLDVARGQAAIASIDNQIQRLSNQRITIQANATAASTQIDQIETQVNQLRDARLNIQVDDNNAEQQLIDLDARIDRLEARRIRLETQFDAGTVNAQLQNIDSRVQELNARRVRLQVDVGDSQQELNRLDVSIEQLNGDNAAAELARLEREIGQLGNQSRQAERPVGNLQAAIAGFAGGAAFAIIDRITNSIAELTQQTAEFIAETIEVGVAARNAEIAFGTILGSAEEADTVLRDLNNFAATTPFDLPGIRQAGQQLLAFGFGTEQLIPTLERVGNVAAGVGQPFDELAEIYGRARVQNRLFAEDINQLTGRGIPIIGALAEQFGVTESEIRGLVESGQVQFANLEQAFVDLTAEGGRFFNLLSQQSETTGGQLSNLGDTVTQFQERLFEAFDPALGAGLDLLTASLEQAGQSSQFLDLISDASQQLQSALEANPELAIELGNALAAIADAGGRVAAQVLSEIAQILSNPEQISIYASQIIETANNIATLTTAVIDAVNVLLRFATGFEEVSSRIVPSLRIIETVLEVIQAFRSEAGPIELTLELTNFIPGLSIIGQVIEGIRELRQGSAEAISPTIGVDSAQAGIDSIGTAIQGISADSQVQVGVDTSAIALARAAAEDLEQLQSQLVQSDIARINALSQVEAQTLSVADAAEARANIEVTAARESLTLQEQILTNLRNQAAAGADNAQEIERAERASAQARLDLAEGLATQREAIENQATENITQSINEQAALVEANAQDRARSLIDLEQNLLSQGQDETVIRATVELQGIDNARAQLNEQIALERQRRDAFAEGTDDRAQAVAQIDQLETQLRQNALDGIRARQQQQQAAEDARIEAIEREEEAATNAINAQAQAFDNFFSEQERIASNTSAFLDGATAAIDAQNSALERRAQLLDAQTNLQGAIDNSEVQGLERALEIRQQLSSEEELSNQERRALERELQAITGSRNTSERRIQQQLLEAEQTRRENALASLNAQQALEAQSLVLDQERERIAAQRAVLEAEISGIQARAAAAALQADRDRLAIQERSLRSQLATSTDPEEQAQLQQAITENQLGQDAAGSALIDAQDQIALQDQAVALREAELAQLAGIQAAQREQLALQQSLAQFELAQSQAAEARATATELAAEGSSSLLRTATANAEALERQRDAAEATAAALLRASQASSNIGGGGTATLTPRREGGPVTSSGGPYLVGEAPNVGPELGVFGNKATLFTQPTILNTNKSGHIYSPEQTAEIFRQQAQINPAIARQIGINPLGVPKLAGIAQPIFNAPAAGMSTAAMERQLAEQTQLLKDLRQANIGQAQLQRRNFYRGAS